MSSRRRRRWRRVGNPIPHLSSHLSDLQDKTRPHVITQSTFFATRAFTSTIQVPGWRTGTTAHGVSSCHHPSSWTSRLCLRKSRPGFPVLGAWGVPLQLASPKEERKTSRNIQGEPGQIGLSPSNTNWLVRPRVQLDTPQRKSWLFLPDL